MSIAWIGCGGAAQEPVATPAKVARVQPPAPKEERVGSEKAKEPAKDKKAARAEAVAEALSELDVKVLRALTQSEVGGVLSSSDVPEGLLDDAALAGVGVAPGAGVGGGAGAIRAGGGGSLSAIGGTSVGSSGSAARGVPRVRGDVSIGPVTENGGTLANSDAAVGRYQSLFRNCYERGLRTDPTQKGSLVVEVDVLTTGRVDEARTAVRQGIDHAVAQCIEARAERMRFTPPSTDVTLAFQVTFTPRSSDKGTK